MEVLLPVFSDGFFASASTQRDFKKEQQPQGDLSMQAAN